MDEHVQRPCVLVVEDRPSVLKLIATVLEREYDVTIAGNGAAAVALLGSRTFDVVVTDVRMPDASGFDVLRAVQQVHPGTAVVMMTAYANIPDAVAAIKNGAYDYVAKPLDADELLLVVARAFAATRDGPGTPGPVPDSDLSVGYHRAVQQARDSASRDYLSKLMARFRGNVTQAATHARMTRESLHRVLRKYAVDFERDRSP